MYCAITAELQVNQFGRQTHIGTRYYESDGGVQISLW